VTKPQIVIVGAGHAGVQLADSLRYEGYQGQVVIVGDEHERPYQRPPLTKDFLHDSSTAELLPLRGHDFYSSRGIDLRSCTRAKGIDRAGRRLLLDDRSTISFDHLVLATGARPKRHTAMRMESTSLHTIRTAHDALRFGRELQSAKSMVIIGAGFIGLEVAAAARARGVEVTIVTSTAPLSRMASGPLSSYLFDAHVAQGSQFVFDDVISIEETPLSGGGSVVFASANRITADLILVAVGGEANAELAEAAGLTVSTGVVVDEFSRTSDDRIWAIGDVAARTRADGVIVREQSVHAATHQAQCLARTLTGNPTSCTEVPWFWSIQGKLRLQIAGIPSSSADAVVRGDPTTGRFSVFNFVAGKLLSVESVNHAGDHLASRRILADGKRLEPEQAGNPQFDIKAFSLEGARVSA
jgi:3-phenylpropionate/trans-cinnamate dioxygenase ferredoxin reductase subunit